MSLVVPLEEIFANKTKLLANHETWERVELGKVSTILNGFPFKSTLFNKSEGFPVIRIRDITRSSTETFYSGDVPPEYVVKKGDLLIGMDGNFRCCEWQGRDAGLNQRVCKITPDERILHRKFLLYGLNGYLKAIEDVTSSVTVGHLSSRDVQRIPFPLPPLGEQRRIVAKLETLLGKVDASQQRLAKIPVLLKRFRQSVLSAACSGRLTADWREENPNGDDASGLVAELERVHEAAGGHKKGNAAAPSDEAHDMSVDDLPSTWRLTEMRSVVCPDRPITYGILKPGPETPGGVLYVRVADFPNDRLNLETVRRTTKEIEKTFARARLRAGDILLSIRGTVGRVCVVPPELENANITQDTARLSVQPALNADFVKWFLRAAPTQKRMQKAVKGVAVRGINIGDVRALQMPVPPLPEQQEIVRRVEGLFALADQLEMRLAKARGQVDALTPSLLARAFAGQLVPQDPNDEPAEKLLERIKGKGMNNP